MADSNEHDYDSGPVPCNSQEGSRKFCRRGGGGGGGGRGIFPYNVIMKSLGIPGAGQFLI